MSDYDERRKQLRYELVAQTGANLCEVLQRLAADVQQRRRENWTEDWPVSVVTHGKLYTAFVFMEWWPAASDEEMAAMDADLARWTATTTEEAHATALSG